MPMKPRRIITVAACLVGVILSAFGTRDTPAEQHTARQATIIGTSFPAIRTETLAGTPLSLPNDARGAVALITIAFKHGTQPQLDSWLQPFLEEFGSKPGFIFYELPMLAGEFKPFAFRIDSGMKSGIDQEKHKHVATYYGDYRPYCKALGIVDETIGYAFLLDGEGIIRWKGMGFATPGAQQEMIEQAGNLHNLL